MRHHIKKISRKLCQVVLFALFTTSAFALVVNYSPGVTFKVVQDQLVFDKSTVKSATLPPQHSPLDHHYRVDVVLTPDAAKKMYEITNAGIGKQALIIVNSHVVSATTIRAGLGNHFEIFLLSKPEAQQLVNSL